MTRVGKIARLPRQLRDQLNRRLQDGEMGKSLVLWLNSLPEVEAILTADFGSRAISEQNLSEWKQGGYREWLAQQEALEIVQRLAGDVSELKAMNGEVTENLSAWLAARYAVAAKRLDDFDEKPDWHLLRELCSDVVALRRGDHYAERLRIERERLEFEHGQIKEKEESEFWEWARQPAVREKLCCNYIPEDEKIERIREKLFGRAPTEMDRGQEPGPEDLDH